MEQSQQHEVVAARFVWDLTDLYPSVEAWNEARAGVQARLAEIEACKGTLGDSAQALLHALCLVSDTLKEAGRVHVYANLNADEDLRVADMQERSQLAAVLFARFSEATAWVQPEILRVGRATIERFLAEELSLGRFAFQLDNSLRKAPHTLGEEAEATLAFFSQPFDAPSEIYQLVANSDIPFPTVTLSTGKAHRIDAQGYSRWRAAPNRDDRRKVFEAFWSTWLQYRNSVGMTLNAHLQTQVALARARHYQSVLARELFEDNLPPAVYRTLVEQVNEALPTLHRYFRLRQRILGLDQLHYYDIYAPLVSLERTFDFEDSVRITLEAISLLGDDWVALQRDAMERRWMHAFPSQGKRSGAYMNGSAYDVHPYVLLNHQDDYESLSTLAHEWGHAMHTLYARQAQPFETADYSTFIAEIPSTSLELILQEYMVRHTDDVEEKLFYLGSGLESLRGTFFRQTMFAEFELALYEAVERGEALTGERISAAYGDLVRRYHGHDEGVVIVDDLYTNEWLFIPHFYFNMYVYQYATSITAATALHAKMVAEGHSAVEGFKSLLRAGSSDYPPALLARAGVDLSTPDPYQAIVARMNAIMDEMEHVLEKRGR